jgi:uncharacterized protein YoxC
MKRFIFAIFLIMLIGSVYANYVYIPTQEDLDRLKTSINSVESQVNQTITSVNSLETKINTLKTSLDQMETKNNTLQETSSELKQTLEELKGNINETKNSLGTLSERIAEQETKTNELSEFRRNVNTLTQQLETADAEIESLKAYVAQKQEQEKAGIMGLVNLGETGILPIAIGLLLIATIILVGLGFVKKEETFGEEPENKGILSFISKTTEKILPKKEETQENSEEETEKKGKWAVE